MADEVNTLFKQTEQFGKSLFLSICGGLIGFCDLTLCLFARI